MPNKGKYDSTAQAGFGFKNTFKLKTVDGIRYDFDYTTGRIRSK